jgi:hypothetical protein
MRKRNLCYTLRRAFACKRNIFITKETNNMAVSFFFLNAFLVLTPKERFRFQHALGFIVKFLHTVIKLLTTIPLQNHHQVSESSDVEKLR